MKDTKYIDPFISSTVNVISTVTQTSPADYSAKVVEDRAPFGDVAGVISMSGEMVDGSMLVSFEKECILKIVNSMLMENFTELSREIVDAVGEITNMICGGAKRSLSESGVSINMARPVLITGEGFNILENHDGDLNRIKFTTPLGNFIVETCFKEK